MIQPKVRALACGACCMVYACLQYYCSHASLAVTRELSESPASRVRGIELMCSAALSIFCSSEALP